MKPNSLIENTYNCVEYCYTLEYYPSVPNTVKVSIPSLMSLMSTSPNIHPPTTVNGNLCNDIECKPNLPSTINLQGFLTVPVTGHFPYNDLNTGTRCVVFFPAYNLEGRFTTIKSGGVI